MPSQGKIKPEETEILLVITAMAATLRKLSEKLQTAVTSPSASRLLSIDVRIVEGLIKDGETLQRLLRKRG